MGTLNLNPSIPGSSWNLNTSIVKGLISKVFLYWNCTHTFCTGIARIHFVLELHAYILYWNCTHTFRLCCKKKVHEFEDPAVV